MLHSAIADTAAEILPAKDVIFTPVELVVVALAKAECGRGSGPSNRFLRAMMTWAASFAGAPRIQALADKRLEALRIFVNSLHRRGHWNSGKATIDLRASGFSGIQEAWLRSRHEDIS